MTTTQQTALVTGANKGIGFETARQLAQLGFTVWLGCRDQGRGEAAAKELAADGDVRFVRLDLTDTVSIQAAQEHIAEHSGTLDVLINNAAIALGSQEGPPSTMRPETIEKTLEVNFYGTLHVTQAFLPLVRKAEAGRIVNLSSSMGSLTMLTAPEQPLAPFGVSYAYSSSKTLVSTLTGWLAVELKDTPVKVNSVCPGFNATDLNGNMGTQHPSEGAKVVVRAATLPADGPSGSFFDDAGPVSW
ncbi:SDR family oxidoreductase [Actinoplanes friuliensis]|uniref:Short chain dehydrogenase/reductase family oxidoreductase n=1 Tax=Actinoplanes friuliensis DSM 7358 TaxID=1246995 RepID=U5VUQ9_9ACTN|nr:SDR family oxidoreductase [Actinoplanes friuliensis]AGZ40723.1 short chain dehydrogenase/reductase family oxidoreductase [Actinoplanes friuliensis DSM 7358]